ncbi:MAG: cytochrome b/b6 domain-containing protein [Candidatus Promineofilum sp.]|nr:cytochrome b/b6 domain-containing protein [Promineifilum sp.]
MARLTQLRPGRRGLAGTFAATAILLLLSLFLFGRRAAAQEAEPPVIAAPSHNHPQFPLLDAASDNVLDSGAAVSTMTTCGGCHDTAFIAANNFHSDAGLGTYGRPGSVPGGRPWDTGAGLFGKWSPITYRYLSPEGDTIVDLTTPEWVQVFGARHAGGGPAVTSRAGGPLAASGLSVDTTIIDPETSAARPWSWAASGTAELNCFTCHLPAANHAARAAALAEGRFGDAVTATLLGTGIVEQGSGAAGQPEQWAYKAAAFDEAGQLRAEFVTVGDPTAANCGSCHGVVHNEETPLTLAELTTADWETLTTGQIMSPQRLNAGGLNLADKATLGRSWDIHMERVVECTDCHYSLNNPVYYQETSSERPEHLTFDPRRVDLGEYIYRPLHQFAKGQSAQGTLAPGFDETIRRCESCHRIDASHNWLPYKERHTAALACETCHVPKLYAPALMSIDWTVLTKAGEPVRAFRGVDGDVPGANTLLSGYEPVLLPRTNRDGTTMLAPFNLISSWYWVYGSSERPVPLRSLRAAYFDGDAYAPDIMTAFDADQDGTLSPGELSITSEAQRDAVGARLAAAGLDSPHIRGEVQPFGINHNVARGEWVTKECRACHGDDSRLAASMTLADRTPGGELPTLFEDGPVSWPGGIEAGEDGALRFVPSTSEAGLYVLGHNAVRVVDILGALMIAGVSLGVIFHGGLRFWAARRRATAAAEDEPADVQRVYMYDVYERLWHWLQTAAILLLLFTGLIIHKPDLFGIFSFSYVVQVHNILALLLVLNAGLSLFYHLASGEIKQFIPRPRGFFDEAFTQTLYYVRDIFRDQPHPIEKTRERKLNPLQQVTYIMVLNVLLPAQIITGALMWGAQRWAGAAAALGGLPWLGPLHSLVAWTFAAFIILHVYLTTTGPTPAASIQAMMLGWEDVDGAGDALRATNEESPAVATD